MPIIRRTSHGKIVRVGILGAGQIVRALHLPVLRALPDVDVRWICDNDLETARSVARTFGVSTACAALDERTEDADVVLVAIPVGARRAALEMILARRQHIFCEKPFAISLEEHRSILAAARNAHVRAGVGLVRRVYASTRMARQVLASRALGKIEAVVAGEGSRLQRTGRGADWYQAIATAAGGGVLMETGPHVIDQVMQIVGARGVSVERCAQTTVGGLDLETTARATLALASGDRVRMRLDVSRVRDIWNGILVRCEHGALRIGLGVADAVEMSGPEGAMTVLHAAGPADTYAAFAREWLEFLGRCRAGDATEEDSGILTTELIDACYSFGHASGVAAPVT